MLGIIHRTMLGLGPPHFKKWFFLIPPGHGLNTKSQTNKHDQHIFDYRDGIHCEIVRRSILGLCRVYNELPQEVVDCKTVHDFQHCLQAIIVTKLEAGAPHWYSHFSPRAELFTRARL